jgi:glycosidase
LPVKWNRKSPLRYSFVVQDGTFGQRLGPKGLTAITDKGNQWTLDPKTFKPFAVPTWVEDTVFYQIFPDRFDNANPKNDPKGVVAWDAEPTYWNWKGGDAAGMQKRLGYLRQLGISGVYINPVMDAVAYHRYDPVDFFKMCPYFGTNEEFFALSEAYEKAGIRVVLDQIFDHVGVTFPPFVDLLKNQQKSKYKDWFFVKEWPVEVRQNPPYVGWFNVEAMPKINLANPEVKKMLFESVDFWMKKAKLSGWRLDVANEVPQWFWREFREVVKKHDPDAWIVGEVWGDARMWLQGDQWDASMNYPFRYANLEFIAGDRISATEFVRRLMEAYDWYAPQVSRNQLNLLSSHDTPRFLTDAGNDRNLAKLAAIVQMTWAGAPSIYYGEEIGMEGGADPANRKGMQWSKATDQNDMLAHYRKLIKIRRDSAILRRGTPVALPCADRQKVAAYARVYDGQSGVILVNRSDRSQQVSVSLQGLGRVGRLRDALTGKDLRVTEAGVISATVPALSAVIGLPVDAPSSSARRTTASHSRAPFEGEKQ